MPGCFVIERLMCKLRSPARELSLCYGRFCDELMREAEALIEATKTGRSTARPFASHKAVDRWWA